MKYKRKPEYVEAYQYHEGEEPQWLKDLIESEDVIELNGEYYVFRNDRAYRIRDTDYVVGVANELSKEIFWVVMSDYAFYEDYEPVIEKSKNEPVEGQTTLEDFGV
ncbi:MULTISPECIES: hypothetical protein [Erysipelotrichaceae]|uniref:hypothetical protein n=1 Tax=Erysipelotrichaceae TaxID=128827 RepID=UPI000E4E5136|nr:hypothetical protein [Absiella sp. AM27-20]RHU03265.1 hypothetical protein DW716_15705 [Absiella sp. AM27-20]DAZ41366.1 MAG TPA: hypothetical protein [Caudoviricetes sp.]